MQGHGYAPPPQQYRRRPSDRTLILLRVVFAVASILSCGALAWVSLLRLAIVTRSRRNWVLFGLSVALTVGLFTVLALSPEKAEDTPDAVVFGVLFGLLFLICGSNTYYLVVDIRHYERHTAGGYPAHAPAPLPPAFGYGYPPAGPPPVPNRPTHAPPVPAPPVPAPPVPAPPVPAPPVPAPAPPTAPAQPGAPGRIDQVRAELDELSDLLRKGKGSESR